MEVISFGRCFTIEDFKQAREIEALINMGEKFAYVRFLAGPYKGSIGYINNISTLTHTIERSNLHVKINMTVDVCFGGPGRSKKLPIPVNLYSHKFAHCFEVLLEYDGPTIFNEVDYTETYKRFAANNKPVDALGNIINIGDTVVFCNKAARHTKIGLGTVREYIVTEYSDFEEESGTVTITVSNSLVNSRYDYRVSNPAIEVIRLSGVDIDEEMVKKILEKGC